MTEQPPEELDTKAHGWTCEVCGEHAVILTAEFRYLCRKAWCAWRP